MRNSQDMPKTLGIESVLQDRIAMLNEPHIHPLTQFVEKIRKETGKDVPYFDPLDGGIFAECLCVLQDPSSKAIKSGFISRNNPDETAKNSFLLYKEAGIPRKSTILWNSIPWKSPEKTFDEIEQGFFYLRHLIRLLKDIRVVLLVGKKAENVRLALRISYPNLKILLCPHPSPLNLNRRPENREQILETLKCIKKFLS